MGRPKRELSQALKDRICREVSLGKSLRSVLKQKGMPSMPKVMDTVQTDAAFAAQYVRARESCIEVHIDGLIDLADLADETNSNALRLRVDVRKWIASKLLPRKYGDFSRVAVDVQERVTLHAHFHHAAPEPRVIEPEPAPAAITRQGVEVRQLAAQDQQAVEAELESMNASPRTTRTGGERD